MQKGVCPRVEKTQPSLGQEIPSQTWQSSGRLGQPQAHTPTPTQVLFSKRLSRPVSHNQQGGPGPAWSLKNADCSREPGDREIFNESLAYPPSTESPSRREFRVLETLSTITDSSPLGRWTTKRLGTQTVWVASFCSKLYYKGRHLRTARAKCSHRCKVE